MKEMERVLAALTNGEALNPLRQGLRLPEQRGLMGVMPAYVGPLNSFGLKIVSVFPNNAGTNHDSHQGAVLLFDATHGSLQAILDGSSITAIRTAAVSGVATKLLARDDAKSLALLGSGVQAHTHLNAMLVARKISHLSVWSPNAEHVANFVQTIRQRGLAATAAANVHEAVKGADIVCTTTSALEPILKGSWLSPGTHVNAVGSSIPSTRELDSAAVAMAKLFVDRRESTLNEAGDFLIPKREGIIGDDHIKGELGEILTGRVTGREGSDEITLFKSLGLGVEDVASARLIYENAVQQNVGTWIEFGGERQLMF